MKKNILEQTETYIRDHGMIEKGDVVIAGVSGGADSVCLLFVLCELRERLGFEVQACHVNHGLRGADADADEMYVRELCSRMGAECRFFHENVESIAKKRKQSCEEAGRAVRRESFLRMCRENGGTKIATAHHRDDNVETVLMNISRGTGVRGLCGIWPARDKWIRPLLWTDRTQIEDFLREQGLRWCTDATNDEEIYTRNRIRRNILPLLTEQVNQGTVRHLDELAEQARELWEYLELGTRQAWEHCVHGAEKPPDGCTELFIDAAAFSREPTAVQKQLIKRCLAEVRGGEKDIGTAHILSVLELFGRQTGRSLDLPGKVTAQRVYGGIGIRRRREQCEASGEKVTLKIPGETRLQKQNMVITCKFIEEAGIEEAREIPQKSYTKWIDYDIIKHGLSVRTRQSGDYLTVDRYGNRQKLKNCLINEKIPREVRDRIPLIADGKHIVWIPGLRMSHAYQIGEKTKKILEIKITEEKENVRDDQSPDFGGKG